jgi:fatty acid desaturase
VRFRTVGCLPHVVRRADGVATPTASAPTLGCDGLTEGAWRARQNRRLNTRTCYVNPISAFIYWNMHYHIEHHMFPMVPYYNLPALHKELLPQVPAAPPPS